MRFDHLQGKPGSRSGVECVASFLEHTVADGGSDPMGRGDHPEGAADFGSVVKPGTALSMVVCDCCAPLLLVKRTPGIAIPGALPI
jgi:hypothetical protein